MTAACEGPERVQIPDLMEQTLGCPFIACSVRLPRTGRTDDTDTRLVHCSLEMAKPIGCKNLTECIEKDHAPVGDRSCSFRVGTKIKAGIVQFDRIHRK